MTLRVAALAFAAALFAAPAWAGECPLDARAVVAAHLDGPRANASVTSEPLISYGLEEHYAIPERALRVRRLTIQPGGVIGLHEHSDRPGAAIVIVGEIVEYRDTCAAGITHRAGDAIAENGPIAHWWRNESAAPAVLIVTDLFAE